MSDIANDLDEVAIGIGALQRENASLREQLAAAERERGERDGEV